MSNQFGQPRAGFGVGDGMTFRRWFRGELGPAMQSHPDIEASSRARYVFRVSKMFQTGRDHRSPTPAAILHRLRHRQGVGFIAGIKFVKFTQQNFDSQSQGMSLLFQRLRLVEVEDGGNAARCWQAKPGRPGERKKLQNIQRCER